MNRFRSVLLVLTIWTAVSATPAFPAPDEYDDSQSHPLRIAAYLLHPAAWLVEWTVFRPFHFLVSATEPQEAIFGHHPHPPVLSEPQPAYDYGMPKRVAANPPATTPAPQIAKQEPVREVVKVVEVPVEKIIYKEVPKIVEVEKFIFPGVAFRFDSADLTDLGKGQVYLAAQKLKEKSDISVVVEGHTDDVGSPEYNQSLGLRRAQKIMAELTAQGIDQSRISTISQGESKPMINQPVEWARAVNRRVEFQVKGQ
jgi:outer membrane protein OmpA-like peptidoglycan-associated protein